LQQITRLGANRRRLAPEAMTDLRARSALSESLTQLKRKTQALARLPGGLTNDGCQHADRPPPLPPPACRFSL
jgi:hypothetical protein